MKCPNFIDEHGGVCVAHGFLYSPDISDRERYCSSPNFEQCPAMKGTNPMYDANGPDRKG